MNKIDYTQTLPLNWNLSATVPFTGLSFLTFVVPFLIGGPQVLVGTIVNAALFASAVLLPKKLFLPLLFFPSLAVLSRGLIFGPFTWYLVYFIPFIWAGNLGLALLFQKTRSHFGFIGGVLTASLFKQGILILGAYIYFQLHLVPELFLKTMGIYQLITALAGGVMAYLIIHKS